MEFFGYRSSSGSEVKGVSPCGIWVKILYLQRTRGSSLKHQKTTLYLLYQSYLDNGRITSITSKEFTTGLNLGHSWHKV